MMVVRGGGSAPGTAVAWRGVALRAITPVLIGSAGVSTLSIDGTTAPGQRVAQLGAHAGWQQSIPSWLIVDEDVPAIGQSAAGTAKAGPEASARDKASTIKAIRRRMWNHYGQQP